MIVLKQSFQKTTPGCCTSKLNLGKILVENNQVVKAKVKWYGLGSYAYPYLWKANKSDTKYQESWDDPRLPKNRKSESEEKQVIVPKRNRGKKI